MKKAIIHQHYPLDYAGEEALNSICTNLALSLIHISEPTRH